MSHRVRNIVIVIVVLLMAAGLVYNSGHTGQQAESASKRAAAADDHVTALLGLLSRRSPVVDYITASNIEQRCINRLKIAFDDAIVRAVTAERDSDEQKQALADLAALQPKLADLDASCPPAAEPQLDKDGNVVPSTTTTTPPSG